MSCDGDNTIFGGAGNDTIHVTTGSSVVYGNLGDDVVYVDSAGCNELWGGGGSDTLVGGACADSIFGGKGKDLIDGRGDSDYLSGGSGADTVTGGDGKDTLLGGTENDWLYGGQGNDILYGGDGNDYVAGDDGADTMNGEAGSDTLVGGNGNDRGWGGSGNDWLKGGAGDDTLSGGKNEGCIEYTGGINTPAPQYIVTPTVVQFGNACNWDFAAGGVTVTGLGIDLCDKPGTVDITNSLGLDGKTANDPGVHEVGYDPASGRSEILDFATAKPITHAVFKLGNFYGPETNGRPEYAGVHEAGRWTAYDAAHQVVKSGTFVANSGAGTYTLDLSFSHELGIRSVSLAASEYVLNAAGDDWTRTDNPAANCLYNDSSDFVIREVALETVDVKAKQLTNLDAPEYGSCIQNICIGDTLTGGSGADTFHYNYDNGVQLFDDFNAAEGDRVKLLGFNMSDLKAALADAAAGDHEDILILGNNMALVNGPGQWALSDFIIG